MRRRHPCRCANARGGGVSPYELRAAKIAARWCALGWAIAAALAAFVVTEILIQYPR
jgi:hypothetical protein